MSNSKNSTSYLQMLGCIVTIAGLFLPFFSITGTTETVRFFEAPDAKIILGLNIFAIVFLFMGNAIKNYKLVFKIISFVLIIGALGIFIYDMISVSSYMKLLSALGAKKSIGFYLIIIGDGIGTLLGLLGLFDKGDTVSSSNRQFVDNNIYNQFQQNNNMNNGMNQTNNMYNNQYQQGNNMNIYNNMNNQMQQNNNMNQMPNNMNNFNNANHHGISLHDQLNMVAPVGQSLQAVNNENTSNQAETSSNIAEVSQPTITPIEENKPVNEINQIQPVENVAEVSQPVVTPVEENKPVNEVNNNQN